VHALRAQVPSVPQAKSTGQVWPAAPQAVGVQWWLAPQLSPGPHSVSAEHPATQPMFVGPHTQGSTKQTCGTAASAGQSESEAQGWETIAQAPPHADCPGTSQIEPLWQSA
jgi:hypothetical protein